MTKPKDINGYRIKESSHRTLEAEADEARSKDFKIQVNANEEIIRVGKSTTNLDLARDSSVSCHVIVY